MSLHSHNILIYSSSIKCHIHVNEKCTGQVYWDQSTTYRHHTAQTQFSKMLANY